MTQLILMLSQLLVLPIQIRRWGDAATASWYAAIAIANITSIADCGLRLAGHAELVRSLRERPGDKESAESFQQVWAWIRVLVLAVTALLILANALYSVAWKHTPYQAWQGALAVAIALETILIVRIMYLDSLGFYRGAEASYFTLAALRLALSLVGLLVFHLRSNGLAWLYFASSILALGWQNRICHKAGTLGLFSRPRKLSLSVLTLARHTLAEPCANWVRLSLPVLITSALAPPAAVTTYVALRAVFGVARASIQQLARVASVEYLRIRAVRRILRAESILTAFMLLSVGFGTLFGASVVIDNHRILSLWLKHFDNQMFQSIVASFALASPFLGYQILLSLKFRIGELGHVAGRLYAFVLYSGMFAGLALVTGSFRSYLILLALAEILLSASFMGFPKFASTASSQAGQRGFAAACCGTLLIVSLSFAVARIPGKIFSGISIVAFGWASMSLVITAGLLTAFVIARNKETWRELRTTRTQKSNTDSRTISLLDKTGSSEPIALSS
ncbi:MAG TPA: hypothetical protein VGL72_19615 [Bryobacteraceae bacterium]